MLKASRRRLATLAAGLLAAFIAPRAGAATAPLRAFTCPEDECGWVYDPAVGDPEHGIAPGVAFEDLPADWVCPNCGREKHRW